ncbi:hypothetical protein HYT55_01390 [Candidatus Woesearchaeota archaeon]|nr:hypothetical protein [Candidatus Woesearchaeota archaeon]
MRKTLAAIASIGLFSLGCEKNIPLREQDHTLHREKIEKYAPEIEERRARIWPIDLSEREFAELISGVNSLSDLKSVIKQRGLYYPQRGTPENKTAIELSYGAPWETHNRGSGVCDELAVYALPFLLNIPTVKNIYLVEIKGDLKNSEEVKENARHAFVLFRDETQRWRYFSNGDISKLTYDSMSNAATATALDTGYVLETEIEYKMREINQKGPWVYNDFEARKLRPESTICPN